MDPPNGHGLYFGIQERAALGPPALRERRLPKDQTAALEEEIIALLRKQAIKKLLPPFGTQGFYSDFKMESIKSLKDVVLPGDYMVKLDLQDAYLTVPMHRSVCKYFRFCWRGEIYEFQSLPFGLAPAPLLFTKLLKPLLGFSPGERSTDHHLSGRYADPGQGVRVS